MSITHTETKTQYVCPQCGEPLEQGQYEFDYETAQLRVVCCPGCGCEGEVVKTEEDE